MLKLYTEKGSKEKVSAIIEEMKKYKGITLQPGKWGQDNRDWYADRENKTISQSIPSIKFLSRQAAEDLYRVCSEEKIWMGSEFTKTKENNSEGNPVYIETRYEEPITCFTDVLRALQMNTCLDTRQVGILIQLGYFSEFGKNQKLQNIYEEYFEGKNKLTKTIKSFNKRLTIIREYEKMQEDQSLPIYAQLCSEYENVGLCFTMVPSAPKNLFFVQDVDTQYGIKAKLYSVQRGTTGTVKLNKKTFMNKEFNQNQLIFIDDGSQQQRYVYKGSQRIPVPGEMDYWVRSYHFPGPPNIYLP